MAHTSTAAYMKVGPGLIGIGALSTMLGSSAAESLTFGSRRAAGLAWASISTFGSLSVIKACIAAATPGWLRETLGVQNSAADSSVVLYLGLKSP